MVCKTGEDDFMVAKLGLFEVLAKLRKCIFPFLEWSQIMALFSVLCMVSAYCMPVLQAN